MDCQLLDSSNVNIYSYKRTMHNSQCTYLNSCLLVATRKYVFHGLDPGIYWTPFWPLLASMHLVATPNPVFNCLWQRFTYYPNVFCYLSGFSLMYKQTSQQRYMIQGTHVYSIHHTSITIHVPLYTYPFFWAGWLSSIPFDRYSYSIGKCSVVTLYESTQRC